MGIQLNARTQTLRTFQRAFGCLFSTRIALHLSIASTFVPFVVEQRVA
jgi:hypothetical protein